MAAHQTKVSSLSELEKIVNPDFLHTYFFRYYEYVKTRMKKGGRVYFGASDILDQVRTDELFTENFGSYQELFEEILLFSRTVKKNKINSLQILRTGERLADSLNLPENDLTPFYFSRDKASKILKKHTKKSSFEYDIRSAWSSCLVGEVPISARRLNLDKDGRLEAFESCFKNGGRDANRYLFQVAAEADHTLPNSVPIEQKLIYVWGFEMADFCSSHDFSYFQVLAVYGLQWGILPGVDRFLKRLYFLKENAGGMIEYNFYKSHMNEFNRLIFKKSPLIENFVLASIRSRVYKALSGYNGDGGYYINLDSISSEKPLEHLKFGDNMGQWRKVPKHIRNFSSADRIAKFDLHRGILNGQNI